MKTLFYPFLLFLNLISSYALASSAFELNTSNTPISQFCQESPETLVEDFQLSIDHLKKRQLRYREDLQFLKHIFYYVHRRHLKRFKPYSSMSDLLQYGAYDCVSGTAIYALILEELGFKYQIWEMNYHVYLSVQLGQSSIVLEATNPIDGFITKPNQIDWHRNYYTEEARQYLVELGKEPELIHRKISLAQLAGLQFYNQAIEAMQNQNLEDAEQYAQQAMRYYPARRIKVLLYMAKNE